MTRIAVVGNCSALGFTNAIRLMSPGSEVRGFSILEFDTNDPSVVLALFDKFDLAFPFAEISNYGLVNERIKTFGRAFCWPSVVFAGFHPDITYFAIGGKPVASCLGGYNSKIAAFAYGHELSVEATANLFNPLTYGLLGYFDAYPLGRRIFLETARSHQLDLTAAFARWESFGVFMHTPNHANIMVINDIARELMRVAGLNVDVDLDHEIDTPDYLSEGVIWPVYPELARRVGVEGSLNFKATSQRGGKIFGLEEFIAESFKEYGDEGFSRQEFRQTDLYQFMAKRLSIPARTG